MFLLSTTYRWALGPKQPPIRLVPETVSPEIKPQVRKLDTHLHLMVELYLHSTILLHDMFLYNKHKDFDFVFMYLSMVVESLWTLAAFLSFLICIQ
jgi:hypothetical protein